MASSDVMFLKGEKLRELAQLIRNHEVNNLYHVNFKNIGDQFKYLRMCNDNLASVNTLLDECNSLVFKFKNTNDGVRGSIAGDILSYTENCLNNALQLINNYTLRRTYLDKMMNHDQQLFQALEGLNTGNDADVADFTKVIQQNNKRVISHMMLSVNTHASQEYSRHLRNSGIKFNDLVRSSQAKLGFTGRFDALEEEQKLEVYGSIIKESGRLSVVEEKTGFKAISYGNEKPEKTIYGEAAMFLIDIARIVWDVYASDHPIKMETREALEKAAKDGGAALGTLVGAAIATKLVGVEATALFVTAAGLVGGYVGGFIFGLAAGLLFDLIFGSGGEATLPTEDITLYVAPMADGRDLAKKISNA